MRLPQVLIVDTLDLFFRLCFLLAIGSGGFDTIIVIIRYVQSVLCGQNGAKGNDRGHTGNSRRTILLSHHQAKPYRITIKEPLHIYLTLVVVNMFCVGISVKANFSLLSLHSWFSIFGIRDVAFFLLGLSDFFQKCFIDRKVM